MRVLAVTPLYPPSSRVGAWLATHELLKGLVARGHLVVVVPFMMGDFEPYGYEGVRVQPPKLRQAAVRQADVVISHLGDGGSTHKLARAAAKPSIRLVHGGLPRLADLSGSSLVVFNSEATAKQYRQFRGASTVIHPPTFSGRYATTPGSKVTLVNLAPEKGGELFWRIARLMPDIDFLGVRGGYGSQAMGRAPNVTVIDNTADMRGEVYSQTRLLLMPSQAESWGMVAVEGMASGIPTLARPTPGLRESLGAAGNWQEGNQADQWVASVRSLLQPDVWGEASARALARSTELDPDNEIARFVLAIEGVTA